MNIKRIIAGYLVVLWAAVLIAAAPSLEAQSLIKRYIVAVGANSGGKARVRLKYAASDAQSVAKIFEDLGGVAKEDVFLLLDPDGRTFYTEMGRLQERMARNRPSFGRTEMFFYYSGHSDEEHIMLGEEKITYKNLRDTIGRMPADVRIAILDSCASGVFTRLKGGKKKAPFLLDEAYNMTGQAFMTSSSATEASQESDLIKSSFFTHYLLSGMRGAADMSQDRRVTLSEAYQFAFQETLAETTRSAGGPQHPNYSIEMAGTGDVVMTDLSAGSSLLLLEKSLAGRLFIHDQNGRLVVEMTKPGGREIVLGLEPGEYRLVYIPDERVYESRVTVRQQGQASLDPDDFVKTDKAYTTPRGDRALRLHDLPLYRETGFEGRPIVNNVGIPTGYTLNKREVILGLGNV
ncbi:MAG TPA: caspase family protein, partial [Acidobacteriota bacterium]